MPLAREFLVWNGACWQEFCALHDCRDSGGVRLKLGPCGADAAFDAWQRARVVAGYSPGPVGGGTTGAGGGT